MLQHMYVNTLHGVSVVHKHVHTHIIRECGSTLYVGMVQGVSFSLFFSFPFAPIHWYRSEIPKYAENWGKKAT